MQYCRRMCLSSSDIRRFRQDRDLSETYGFPVSVSGESAPRCCSVRTGKLTEIREQKAAAALIRDILAGFSPGRRILAAGIGNPAVTPDSLGPVCIGYLVPSPDTSPALFTTVPDIPARTGMDTAELIRAAASVAKADCIITVDAMAAASEDSLASVIQITDLGSTPGSGTDSGHSGAITAGTMGMPVISIGVPTVMEQNGLLVTTADCDHVTKTFARVIAWGILQLLTR